MRRSDMTRFRYQLIKHKDFILYTVCFVAHLLFAPVCYRFHFDIIGGYNIAAAFLYGTFILFYKDLPNRFFFTFSYFELLGYSVFTTIIVGADCGTTFFTINVLPALFLFTIDSYKNKVYSVLLSTASGLCAFFIVWWDFIRPDAMSNGYLTAVTVNRTFYIIDVLVCTTITATFLFYLSITVSMELNRSKRKAQQHAAELYFMANHDPLTGLLNRRKISALLSECEKQAVDSGTPYAVTIFDIDNFKHVNDTYGHDAGDFVLKQITALVKATIPENSQLARWGGEEFLILFSNNIENTRSELEIIRRQVETASFIWNNKQIPITLTFGLADSKQGTSADRMIITADNNLMYGKQHGKNCVITTDQTGDRRE